MRNEQQPGCHVPGAVAERPNHRDQGQRSADWRRVCDGLALPVFVHDRETLLIVDCNDRVPEVYGWSRQELIGRPIWTLHVPEEADLVRARLASGEVGRCGSPHRYRQFTRDGHRLDVEISSAAIEYTGRPAWASIVQDLGGRLRAERELEESRAALAATLDSTADGILVVSNEGRVVFTNKCFATMWRIPDSVLAERDDEKLIRHVIEQLSDPDTFVRRVHELYGTDAEETAFLHFRDGRVFERFTRPLTMNGHVEGRLWSFRDMTDRVSAEMALVESERLLHAAKDAAETASRAKSAFLASMSHEMRTPLNGLLGLTALVLDTELTAEQRDCLETVRQSAADLLELINDLLDLAKIEAGRMELAPTTITLRRQLALILRPFVALAREKGLTLDWDVDDAVPDMVRGDPKRLRQVVVNLVGNAIKFTTVGGIRIHVGLVARWETEVDLRFSVSDTGLGIPAAQLTRIFEPFVQADDAPSHPNGTGLGLSIAREFARLMGGRLEVKSEEGHGSVFSFTVRCVVIRESSSSAAGHGIDDADADDAAPPSRPVAARPARVLVAEDNRVNQKLMRLLLERWGHTVCLVPDGREAVAAVAREPWDIVLMDVQMPEMDGLAATRAIREDERQRGAPGRLPIVALTAHALQGDEERCRAAGMDGYVAKPIDPCALQRAMDGLLAPLATGRR